MQWLNKHLAETTASRVGGKERADRRSEIHPTFGDLQSPIGLMIWIKRKNKFGCFEVQMSQIPRASHGARRSVIEISRKAKYFLIDFGV